MKVGPGPEIISSIIRLKSGLKDRGEGPVWMFSLTTILIMFRQEISKYRTWTYWIVAHFTSLPLWITFQMTTPLNESRGPSKSTVSTCNTGNTTKTDSSSTESKKCDTKSTQPAPDPWSKCKSISNRASWTRKSNSPSKIHLLKTIILTIQPED